DGGQGGAKPVSPASLRATIAPVGGGAPGGSELVAGAMPVTSQCVNVPCGASGSSTRIAMLRVAAGMPAHASGGDLPGPAQVNSTGIAPPFSNAVDVTRSELPAIAGTASTSEITNTEVRIPTCGCNRCSGSVRDLPWSTGALPAIG